MKRVKNIPEQRGTEGKQETEVLRPQETDLREPEGFASDRLHKCSGISHVAHQHYQGGKNIVMASSANCLPRAGLSKLCRPRPICPFVSRPLHLTENDAVAQRY